MDLFLVRHGIAIDRQDPNCPPEEERYLTPEGMDKTRKAARGLKALKVQVEVMLSSPLRRAVETAEIFAKVLEFPRDQIRLTDALRYETSPREIFKEIKALKAQSVMCFGHAPQLDEVLAHAVGCPREITALKKAGVACLELEVVEPPRGQILWVLSPKIMSMMK